MLSTEVNLLKRLLILLIAAISFVDVAEAGDATIKMNSIYEPDIAEVQRAAAKFAGFDLDRASSWKKNAAHSAWLPELRVKVRKDNFINNGEKYNTDTPYELITFADGIFFEISARWNLDELIFNKEELDAAGENAAVFGEYSRLMEKVSKLYFARRRLASEAQTDGIGDDQRKIKTFEYEEISAVLDSLTGGIYTRHGGNSGIKREAK